MCVKLRNLVCTWLVACGFKTSELTVSALGFSTSTVHWLNGGSNEPKVGSISNFYITRLSWYDVAGCFVILVSSNEIGRTTHF